MKPVGFTLRQIQYVVAVAETLSFRRAAERCNVSQPSLSAQIAEMEACLGVPLFERDRRGVLLTTAGNELLDRMRRVLLEVDDVVETARRFLNPFTGTLRIGVIPTMGPYLLPKIAPALRKTYPKLTLVWREDKTEALVRAINSGDLDAAFLALEADLGDLEYDPIAKDPFVLATPHSHPLSKSAVPIASRQLRGEAVLLLDEGHCFRDQVIDFCSNTGTEELGFRATSLPTLTQMVASGMGITLLPEMAVSTEKQRSALEIRPFARPVPYRTIVLGWRRRTALAGTLQGIAEITRSALQKAKGTQKHKG
jgi:LysR family hydrogen peroxide-inducible transcriptional activator